MFCKFQWISEKLAKEIENADSFALNYSRVKILNKDKTAAA